MKVLEIYFSDLTEKMQEEVLNFYGAESVNDTVYANAPICILEADYEE